MTVGGRLLRRMVSSSASDLRSRGLWRACVAECLGSLLLLFFCCAPNIDFPTVPGSGACFSIDAKVLRAGFTSGLSVACIVWSIGHISGAHINPALTMAFLVTGKVSLVRAALYIPMQCTGGVGGAMLLKLLTPFQLHNVTSFGVSSFNSALTHPAQAFGTELVLTFAMILPVFACTDRLRFDQTGSVSLIAGLQVSCCIFAGGVLSGASMNPIRALGPAVASGRYDQLWVYVAGPTCGGCLSGLTYVFLFKGRFMLPDNDDGDGDGGGGASSGCGGSEDGCAACRRESGGDIGADGGSGADLSTASANGERKMPPPTSQSIEEQLSEKRRRVRVTTADTSITEL